MIRTLAAVLCSGVLLSAPCPGMAAADTAQPAAAAPAAAKQSQQDRMRSCNGAAGDRALKGSVRQSFMSSCLAGKADPTTMMKTCNAEAGLDKITSDARRSYMSACLKSPG